MTIFWSHIQKHRKNVADVSNMRLISLCRIDFLFKLHLNRYSEVTYHMDKAYIDVGSYLQVWFSQHIDLPKLIQMFIVQS